jgi:D-arabinose 1-dehydrogenase-like Zn-dependent alcohol dehydrogenase
VSEPAAIPAPLADEVVIRIGSCALGRADLPGRSAAPGSRAGVAGVVVRAGVGAGALEGARVIASAHDPCGECDTCRRGDTAVCPHATLRRGVCDDGLPAAFLVARARWVLPVDGELAVPGPEAATLARDAAIAYACFVRLGAGPGEPVVIAGVTAVARLLVDIALARGARPVVLHRELGRDHTAVVSPDAPLAEGVRAAARTLGVGTAPLRVCDTGGDAACTQELFALAAPATTFALCAPSLTGADPVAALDAAPLLEAGATLIGVAGTHPELLPELAAMAMKGELDLAAASRIERTAVPSALAAAVAAAERGAQAAVFVTGA